MVYVPGRSATKAPSGQIRAPFSRTDQATSTGREVPFLSLAEKWTTSPVLAEEVAGETARPETQFFATVMEVSPVTPSPDARTRVSPGLRAWTPPAVSTVATAGFSDDQVSAMSVRGSPLGLRGVATRRWLEPTANGRSAGGKHKQAGCGCGR